MNDRPDDTTQVTPIPDPPADGSPPASGSKLPNWSLSRWRAIAVTTSSLFLVSLVLLGWQVAEGDDYHGRKFGAHGGPGMQQRGGFPGGEFEGGPPQGGPPPQGMGE